MVKATVPNNSRLLSKEGLECSWVCVVKILKKFQEKGGLNRRTESGQTSIVTSEIEQVVCVTANAAW